MSIIKPEFKVARQEFDAAKAAVAMPQYRPAVQHDQYLPHLRVVMLVKRMLKISSIQIHSKAE